MKHITFRSAKLALCISALGFFDAVAAPVNHAVKSDSTMSQSAHANTQRNHAPKYQPKWTQHLSTHYGRKRHAIDTASIQAHAIHLPKNMTKKQMKWLQHEKPKHPAADSLHASDTTSH